MTAHYIESDALRVGIATHYGARVVSLIDKRNGREWMSLGGESANVGEDTVYAGDEAVGWDECFPTVGTWDGTATAWGRPLRDHGDVWGRPWQVDAASATELAASYHARQFSFARTLRVEGPALVADYAVTNLTGEPLPYLWALHGLFAVQPGDRIELPGIERVSGSYRSPDGGRHPVENLSWTGDNGVLPFPLDEVQAPIARFAAKFLVGDVPGGTARLGQPGQWLQVAWDRRVDALGIWLTYGFWPTPGAGAHYEVALEPTSAPANDLGQAIASGASPLAAGERREWQVTLTVSA